MKIYIVENEAWEIVSIHKTKKGAENKIKALSGEKFQKYSASDLPQVHKKRPEGWTGQWIEPRAITEDDFASEYQIKEVDLNEDENQPNENIPIARRN
jgi:hypothetical protein